MTVKYTENPNVNDVVVFDLKTTDSSGCATDPYLVETIVVYSIERDFGDAKVREYEDTVYDSTDMTRTELLEAAACENPSAENIQAAKKAREEAESRAKTTPFYYAEAKPVKVIGSVTRPAWNSLNTDDAQIEHVTEDDDENPLTGMFRFEWDTTGMREGDYFVCWTWKPLVAGDSISQHAKFYLRGSIVSLTSIPSHYTNPEKYPTLLNHYLPNMYKVQITDDDRSPDVLKKFNACIASGFEDIENLANQVVDLLDANSTHELYLPLLANTLGVRLATNDPTLWRRQIRTAVQLFKKKGTKSGLREALAQAGIQMTRLARMWQVISKYTWIESFVYEGEGTWTLEKTPLETDADNFGIWLRPQGEDDYVSLTSEYVSFSGNQMTWEGELLSVSLMPGDRVKVLYKYAEIPDSEAQTLENYVRSLPLADDRDELDQDYPLKNWNVRVIEEDDPLIDLIVGEKHPYVDPLVFGKVRTEFAWSENAYNRDEYNGSIRDSIVPCDIDKDFVDPCTSCLGSRFAIDLEIENLSNDRIDEARRIISDYSPFHATVHKLNFSGSFVEYVPPPVEEISINISFHPESFVISGSSQTWFLRSMRRGLTTNKVLRTDLSESTQYIFSDGDCYDFSSAFSVDFVSENCVGNGIAYNVDVTLFSPDYYLDRIGMSLDDNAILEVLAPSASAGNYVLRSPIKNTAIVFGADEPIDESSFTFRISNILHDGTGVTIEQSDEFRLSDATVDFGSVKSLWDVSQGTASAAWSVSIPLYSGSPYAVVEVLPNGILVLQDDGTLPPAEIDVEYELFNGDGDSVASSEGLLKVVKRGVATFSDTGLQDIRKFLRGECWLATGTADGDPQYKVCGFITNSLDQCVLENYDGGDVAGTMKVFQRLINNAVGYFSYRGMGLLVEGSDLETYLGIQNGHRTLVPEDEWLEDNNFKENFLVVIDGENYFIADIDGDSPSGSTTIVLEGASNYWKTMAAGGTAVSFDVYRFVKKAITVQPPKNNLSSQDFVQIDRRNNEIIQSTTETVDSMSMLSSASPLELIEEVRQKEAISFKIEYVDGSVENGTIKGDS